MSILQLNFSAVMAATLACFLIGFIWYSQIAFGEIWREGMGKTKEQMRADFNPGMLLNALGMAFIYCAVMDMIMAFLTSGGNIPGVLVGILIGVLIAVGIIAPKNSITFFFEKRSMKLFFLHTGHDILTLATAGAIVGAWRG